MKGIPFYNWRYASCETTLCRATIIVSTFFLSFSIWCTSLVYSSQSVKITCHSSGCKPLKQTLLILCLTCPVQYCCEHPHLNWPLSLLTEREEIRMKLAAGQTVCFELAWQRFRAKWWHRPKKRIMGWIVLNRFPGCSMQYLRAERATSNYFHVAEHLWTLPFFNAVFRMLPHQIKSSTLWCLLLHVLITPSVSLL